MMGIFNVVLTIGGGFVFGYMAALYQGQPIIWVSIYMSPSEESFLFLQTKNQHHTQKRILYVKDYLKNKGFSCNKCQIYEEWIFPILSYFMTQYSVFIMKTFVQNTMGVK